MYKEWQGRSERIRQLRIIVEKLETQKNVAVSPFCNLLDRVFAERRLIGRHASLLVGCDISVRSIRQMKWSVFYRNNFINDSQSMTEGDRAN